MRFYSSYRISETVYQFISEILYSSTNEKLFVATAITLYVISHEVFHMRPKSPSKKRRPQIFMCRPNLLKSLLNNVSVKGVVSSLVQVMVGAMQAPRHYLIQWWLIFNRNKLQWEFRPQCVYLMVWISTSAMSMLSNNTQSLTPFVTNLGHTQHDIINLFTILARQQHHIEITRNFIRTCRVFNNMGQQKWKWW